MPILECENLSKEFTMYIRDGKRVVGFPPVSFSVSEGGFLGVRGPSGIGKSSLLKCIYRTYLPTTGTISYTRSNGGRIDIAKAADEEVIKLRRTDIAYVSQFFHVIPRVTALDTVKKVFLSRGYEADESREKTVSLFTRLGLSEAIWELFPSTFSGGEKQRLNIIHAVAAGPRLLLLDEPTASLDTASSVEVISLIRELRETGTTMIGVFHDQRLIGELADEQLVFEDREREEARV